MDYDKVEALEKEFEESYDKSYPKFEDFEGKLHPNKDIAAILFLYSKLKKGEKPWSFLHGEHDIIYVGAGYDIFEDFTVEDVRTCRSLGICMESEGDGFMIFASM